VSAASALKALLGAVTGSNRGLDADRLDARDPAAIAARRDEVLLGSRCGFVRAAQAAGVPIVPIVAHGAHRSAYIFSEGEAIARLLKLKQWARVERFPFALALPWGLAMGPWLPYLPLPWPIQIRALPAIRVPAGAEPHSIWEQVRGQMQDALDELASRPMRAH
jgi:1-acyl-sn-glycerol-3-phosphate acyltransferase